MSKKETEIKLYDFQAESALLGIFITNSDTFLSKRIYLESKNFYEIKNQIIYQSMIELSKSGIEIEPHFLLKKIIELSNFKIFKSEEEILDYIISLSTASELKDNADFHLQTIVDFWKKRQFISQIEQLQTKIKNKNFNLVKSVEDINVIVNSVENYSKNEFQDFKKVLDKSIKRIENLKSGQDISGLESGWPSLDDMLLGFNKGDLCIIAARPSMGKTAFAVNLATNIAKKQKKVAIFSLEMPAEQLANRILSSESLVQLNKIRKPKFLGYQDFQKIQFVKETIENWKIFIDDTAGIDINDLIWKSRRLKKLHGLDIIIIDYLQLIETAKSSNFENRQREVTIISSKLKQLARQLELPVIALSQLSRRVEQREEKIPLMSDLRESGSLEQDADQILFLYREAYYKRDKIDFNEPHSSKIIIAKHRNGSTGEVELLFDPQKSTFINPKINFEKK